MLLKVEKMTCNHCVRAVTAAVHALDARAQVDVDLAAGTVRITGNVDPQAAAAAIREAGYTADVSED